MFGMPPTSPTDLAGHRGRDRRRRRRSAPRRPRGLRLLARTVFPWLGRRLPPRLSRSCSAPAWSWRSFWGLWTGVIVNGFFAGANAIFAPRTPPARTAPTSPGRRALRVSPQSLVGWEGLGLLRAALRARRPHRSPQLEAVNGPRRQGADPGLRRPAERRHRAGPRRPRARRAQAHRRLRPQGARRRHHHRHGLPRQPRHRPARVPLERRHRDRRRAVLLPAELDLAARRPGGRRRHLPRRLRDGAPVLGDAARGERPELYLYGLSLGSMGVESMLTSVNIVNEPVDGALMVGPAVRQRDARPPHGRPRRPPPGIPAGLRGGPHGALHRRAERPRPRSARPGARPASPTSSTPATPSSSSRRPGVRPRPSGSRTASAAPTSRRAWAGSRS